MSPVAGFALGQSKLCPIVVYDFLAPKRCNVFVQEMVSIIINKRKEIDSDCVGRRCGDKCNTGKVRRMHTVTFRRRCFS